MDFDPQYLTFKVSHADSLVKLSIEESSRHNNEKFGGCFIKIKQISSILQGF